MSATALTAFLARCRQLYRPRSRDTDAALLQRFSQRRDADAFEELLHRHAALVWGVCRRVLPCEADCDDAFQATFLALVRRADTIQASPSLGAWLHTVAVRLARKIQTRTRRQRTQAVLTESAIAGDVSDEVGSRELFRIVDEEIERLPSAVRMPLLLCCLQGQTRDEAAQSLGCSVAAIKGRLERGRELLRRRLQRRGVELPLAFLALTLTGERIRAALWAKTMQAVLYTPTPAIVALAEAGASALTVGKGKLILAMVFLATTAVGVAGSLLTTTKTPEPSASLPREKAAPEPKKPQPPQVRLDRHGDPLPEGAIARLGTLRFRLPNAYRILNVAFAPDGKTLAASSGALTSFDTASGKQTKTIKEADADIHRCAYSPDGKRLLTYTHLRSLTMPAKAMVQIRDAASGGKLSETELAAVCWLGWSEKNEARVACLGKEEIVYHELAGGRKLRLPAKDMFVPALVSQCRCVAAKNLLAAGDGNGFIHIWDLNTGKKRFALHPGVFVMSLDLSPDARWLAAISRDAANKNPVQLWDMETGKIVRTLPSGYEVLFAPDGKTLAVKSWREIVFYDPASGRERSRIRTANYQFGEAYAFAPDGKTFATSEYESGVLQLWNVADGTRKPQPQGHSHRPNRIAFSPDGKRVATCAGTEGTIHLWDAATGEPLTRISRDGWARDSAFSADGRTLYSCWLDDKLHFDDAADGRELHALKVFDPERAKTTPSGLLLHLSDDRARLTVFHTDDDRGMDMLVTGWDTATRKQIFRRRRVDDIFFNTLSADGRMLATAYAGTALGGGQSGREMGVGPMHLEDVAGGETLLTFPKVPGQTVPLAFSPDGRLLVSYTDNTLESGKRGITLRLWEVATAKELRSFLSSFSRTTSFSPNGGLLAMTTEKGEIRVWDLRLDKEHRLFRGFDAPVSSLAFAPDGRRLISGLADTTLLVWEIPPYENPRVSPTAEGIAKAWDDLAGSDAPRAFQARGALASAPKEALPLLTKHLHPAKSADPQCLRRLLADLDSERFSVRQKAQDELVKLGDLAEPALRRALEDKPTLEVRKRVQALLERLHGPVTKPEMLQSLRAVAALEDIGTPEARRLLNELAQGAPEARQTLEAKASLERLRRRLAVK